MVWAKKRKTDEEIVISPASVDVGIDSTLPSNKVVWSTGRNVRFTPGYVSKTLGQSLLGTLAIASLPIRAMFTFMGYDGNMYTIICCDAHVYVANGVFDTFLDITPTAAPTSGADDHWKFDIVAGLPILTNGKDATWQWTAYSAILTALSNAPLAKNISSCMHRLVSSNLYDGGYYYPGRVKWTETGNPTNSTVDTTKKAGRFDLINYETGKDAQHNILAQITDGSKTYFFTERNLWGCDFAQGIKQFYVTEPDFEILSAQSACIHNGIIYAAAKDSFYRIVNGKKQELKRDIRSEFIANRHEDALNSAFCFDMVKTNEIWFCVSTGTEITPDTAYIYNWELDNWTVQDCNFLCHSSMYPPPLADWENSSHAAVGWTGGGGVNVNWMANISALYNTISRDVVGNLVSQILQMDDGYNF